MDPLLISAAGGILQGLFGGGGGQPELTPEAEWIFKFNRRIAQDLLKYSKSVPGSDPLEAASLASGSALLGQNQGAMRGALSAVQNPYGSNAGNTADQQMRLGQSDQAQQAALLAAFMNQFRQDRKGAPLQAAGVMSGTPLQYQSQEGSNISALLGSLSQNMAYLQALKGTGASGGAPRPGPSIMPGSGTQSGAQTRTSVGAAPGGVTGAPRVGIDHTFRF